jgi:hypothetical protein
LYRFKFEFKFKFEGAEALQEIAPCILINGRFLSTALDEAGAILLGARRALDGQRTE